MKGERPRGTGLSRGPLGWGALPSIWPPRSAPCCDNFYCYTRDRGTSHGTRKWFNCAPMPRGDFSMIHRRDIDGLRGVAVLLVLCYHAQFSFAPSGYIGVDVFLLFPGLSSRICWSVR
jgi:hypothetical protein